MSISFENDSNTVVVIAISMINSEVWEETGTVGWKSSSST